MWVNKAVLHHLLKQGYLWWFLVYGRGLAVTGSGMRETCMGVSVLTCRGRTGTSEISEKGAM